MSNTFGRLAYPLAAVIVLLYLSPLLYVLLSSLRPATAITMVSTADAYRLSLDSYVAALQDSSFVSNLVNSAIVTAGTTSLALILGSGAAYAVARLRIGRGLASWILLARMVPPITLILPFFLVYRSAGLIDTRLGLIIAYTAFNLPMVIWLLVSFFEPIPRDYDDAARIDGASLFQIMLYILWPLARPGVAATALMTAIYSWNEFLFALILTASDAQTAPIGITRFVSERTVNWGALAAAGTIISLPVTLFALLMRRQLVQGLSGGQLK